MTKNHERLLVRKFTSDSWSSPKKLNHSVQKKKQVSESVRLVDFTADQSVPYLLIFLRKFLEELQITIIL